MRYHAVQDGEWVQPNMRRYYMKCCDCGLVHRLVFRIAAPAGVKLPRARLAVQFQAFRLRSQNSWAEIATRLSRQLQHARRKARRFR